MLHLDNTISPSSTAKIVKILDQKSLCLSNITGRLVLNNTLDKIIGLPSIRIPYFLDLIKNDKTLNQNDTFKSFLDDLYQVPELLFALIITNLLCSNDPSTMTDRFGSVDAYIQACITKAYTIVSQGILLAAIETKESLGTIQELEQLFNPFFTGLNKPLVIWNDDISSKENISDMFSYGEEWINMIKKS